MPHQHFPMFNMVKFMPWSQMVPW